MTTRPKIVPFGPWTPDRPASANKGCLIAKNVIPQIDGYRDLKSLSSFSNALSSACLGTFWAQDSANTVFNFAGDTANLYRLTGGNTWTNANGAAAPYSANNWEFTKFGDRVIAANIENVLQKFDMGTDTNFASLAGSPPQAARIATVRDFVMLGDIDSLGPNFVQWSGYNNSEIWTPGIATQSDSQELFGRGGRIQRIVPGEYATIFMEHSIFTAEYAGPPVIFQFDEIERKRGTPSPNSVVWAGGHIWYYGWDDFYHFNGAQSKNIGSNRVARWFKANAAGNALDSMRGAIDRANGLIMWAFKSSASAATNNRLLVYSLFADKWSFAEVDTEVIDEYVSPGYDLDTLTTILTNGIDTDSIPVESTEYKGGDINVSAFDSLHQAATFAGAPLTAILETAEQRSMVNERLYINNLRPIIEGSAATVITGEVGYRDRLSDNVNYTFAKGENGINGQINVRRNARFMRYRLNITGGFDHALGVIPNDLVGGGR